MKSLLDLTRSQPTSSALLNVLHILSALIAVVLLVFLGKLGLSLLLETFSSPSATGISILIALQSLLEFAR